MTYPKNGPAGVTTGAALHAATYPDDSGPHRSAEAPSDPADVRLRLEEQRVARRQRRHVEADLTELQREVCADDNLAREAWSSRSADVIRQDQLSATVSTADYLRVARLLVYVAVMLGLHPDEVRPW